MTRIEIKEKMISRINDTLTAELEDINLADLIDEDTIYDFLWNKDFGMNIVKAYIDDHTDELVEDYLEEIFDEIDQDDLDTPW